ncbi:hypothetical protein MSG_02149 [Mycobacterium shigaense]|uniref:Uncharacterized protein n=1 Tax=Mycobacterium shigaense TaxID=722731 RepID=A0A1Z4EH42_9MYCO|nr:hypothetical protein MSG_02149 [Mycobacterium shigaense]
MPSCCRKPFPIWAVTCVEVAEIPRTWLITATGSPGTLALGTIGSVGSQPSHLRPPTGGADAGAPGSQRSPDVGPPGAPRPVDQVAEASWACWSFSWAASRSAASRVTCSRWSSNFCFELVSAATAASWLAFASVAALSAFCLASRAADALFTCSVRARCRLSITFWELADRVRAAVAVAMMSSGLRAVR